MVSALRYSGLSSCLALTIIGCSGGTKSPPAANSGAMTPVVALANSSSSAADQEKVLNVYNWSDFFDASVISAFEMQYGIKVNYDVFDSSEMLETKLLAGHSSYDVVVPGGVFLERQIEAGVYQKLDKAQLPNLKNVDPEALRGVAEYDPGNQYALPYNWLQTTGIGYDIAKITARLPDAPVDSWRMFYDPAVISKFQSCGVEILDAPEDVLPTVLFFLGRDPNSQSPGDLKDVEGVLLSIRSYIRYVDSDRFIQDLADGDACVVLGWSGSILQARERSMESGKHIDVAYSIPREGSISISDMLAIAADAPHPNNAHLFINYLMRPDVAIKTVKAYKYADPIDASVTMDSAEIRSDPGIFPPPEIRRRLVQVMPKTPEFTRLLMRMWTRFKTGK